MSPRAPGRGRPWPARRDERADSRWPRVCRLRASLRTASREEQTRATATSRSPRRQAAIVTAPTRRRCGYVQKTATQNASIGHCYEKLSTHGHRRLRSLSCRPLSENEHRCACGLSGWLSYSVNVLGDNLGVVAGRSSSSTERAPRGHRGLFVCARSCRAHRPEADRPAGPRASTARAAAVRAGGRRVRGPGAVAAGPFSLAAVWPGLRGRHAGARRGGISRAASRPAAARHAAEGNGKLTRRSPSPRRRPAAAGVLVGTVGAVAALWVDAGRSVIAAACSSRATAARSAEVGGVGVVMAAECAEGVAAVPRAVPHPDRAQAVASSLLPRDRSRVVTRGVSRRRHRLRRAARGRGRGDRARPAVYAPLWRERPRAGPWSARRCSWRRLLRAGRGAGIVLACVASVVGGTGTGAMGVGAHGGPRGAARDVQARSSA